MIWKVYFASQQQKLTTHFLWRKVTALNGQQLLRVSLRDFRTKIYSFLYSKCRQNFSCYEFMTLPFSHHDVVLAKTLMEELRINLLSFACVNNIKTVQLHSFYRVILAKCSLKTAKGIFVNSKTRLWAFKSVFFLNSTYKGRFDTTWGPWKTDNMGSGNENQSAIL